MFLKEQKEPDDIIKHQNLSILQQNDNTDKNIHDPLLIKQKSKNISCQYDKGLLCEEIGSPNALEGQMQNEIGRIRNHIESIQAKTDIKLFCAIYSFSANSKFTDAQSETWAKKCDGVLFSSDVSNSTTGHFYLPSSSKFGFGYKGMIQRLRAMYTFIYENYLHDYDFFHFCGDDTYVIVENLKFFLSSNEVQQWEKDGNYFAGGFWAHWGKMREGDVYLAGGSGYTISRKALSAYVEGPLQFCDTTKEGSAEDVQFSKCFQHIQKTFFYTGDSDGSQRYHQGPIYDPIRYRIFRSSLQHIDRLPVNLTNLIEGVRQKIDKKGTISNSSIAFHKHYSPTELRRLHILLYDNLSDFCSSCK